MIEQSRQGVFWTIEDGNAAAVALLQQFDNYYARVTLKNGVNTNVRTASRAIGSVNGIRGLG
jgi:hypothetical protein